MHGVEPSRCSRDLESIVQRSFFSKKNGIYRDFHGISMGFHGISMGFPWDFMAMFRISWDLMESNWNKNPIWNRLE